MQQQVNQLVSSGNFSQAMQEAGLGPVIDVSVVVMSSASTTSSSAPNQTGMIIGIVLGATFIICLAIIGIVCYMRKRAKITQICV